MKPFYRLLCLLALALLAPPLHAERVKVGDLYYNLNTDGTCEVTYLSYNDNHSYVSGNLVIPEKIEYNSTVYAVTTIGKSAFDGCRGLTSVSIPNSINSIGDRAFSSCGLTSVSIPASVNLIGGYAFNLCMDLTKAEFASIESLCSIDFSDFGNPLDHAHHLYIDDKEITELVIPESVKSIGDYTFSGCSGLTSVYIHNSVNSIGSHAFSNCSGLTSVSIPNSVNSIGDYAFYGCSGLTSISIPNSVSSIESGAFSDCSGLTSISIPNSINSIGSHAFSGCNGLTSISIPDSVNSIEDCTFSNCSSLTSVSIPNSVKSIGVYAFSDCNGLTSVSIPNSVNSIGEYAFENCSGLTSVSIPNSVTSIEKYAFRGCSGLTSVFIPNSITSIGAGVFNGCSKLVSYEVKNIGQTKATINVKHNGFEGWNLFCGDTKLKMGENKATGLEPGALNTLYVKGEKARFPLDEIDSSYWFTTNKITISSSNSSTASSVAITPKFSIDGDAEGYWPDNTKIKGTRVATGLDPAKSYSYTYCVKGPEWSHSEKLTASTQELTMTTLPGVALNSSTALLCSEVNLHEDEVNVGFEWRRYDAPATLPSSKVTCAIADGKLTGALSGLNPTAYYNYRPYYTSNSGNTYYGEWITIFTGDAGVHFDPTVKTYSASMLGDFSAQLKGYALRGSDEIARQGFQYWSSWSTPASRAASDVTEVEVKGQKFTHTLTDLNPSTTYYYRTFVETDAGAFYGEEQSFTTPAASGVNMITTDDAEVEVIGYYNLQGVYSTKPFEGLNIVVYSDGSTRKMIFR